MAEIKDSPEKDDRISLTEIASISTLLFVAFGAIIYVSGAYSWSIYLHEMKLTSYQFPVHVNDVNIVGGSFLFLILGLALLFYIVVIGSFVIVNVIKNIRSKNIKEQEKIKEENKHTTPAYKKKNVIDKAFVVLGHVILPSFASIVFFYFICLEILTGVSRSTAQETLTEINNSTTRLPKLALVLEDGQIYCPPGVRIVCSERFCGFNDGKNSTVVSLERVRSIQTELPAECPTAPPGSEAKSAAALFF